MIETGNGLLYVQATIQAGRSCVEALFVVLHPSWDSKDDVRRLALGMYTAATADQMALELHFLPSRIVVDSLAAASTALHIPSEDRYND